MFCRILPALLVSLVTLVSAAFGTDREALRAFLNTQYGSEQRAKLRTADFLRDARQAGLVLSADHEALATAVLCRDRCQAFGIPSTDEIGSEPGLPLDLPPGHGQSSLASSEREPNDTRGFADEVFLGDTYVGTIANAFERDWFAIDVPVEGVLTLTSNAGTTGTPIQDTTLTLTDERGGFLDFNDDRGLSLYAQLSVPVRPGRYHARVGGFFLQTGSYEVVTSFTASPIQNLAAGQTTQGALSLRGEIRAYALPLVNDMTLRLDCLGINAFVPSLSLRTGSGAEIAVSRPSAPTTATIDISLPRGEYQLWVRENRGASGLFSLQVRGNLTAVGDTCSRTMQGSLATPYRFDIHGIENPTGHVLRSVLSTVVRGTNPARDTYIELYDETFRLMARNDDAPGRPALSSLDLPLPPGSYWVLVSSFPGTPMGDYDFQATCQWTPVTRSIGCDAPELVTLNAPGDAILLEVDPGNATAFEVVTRVTSGSNLDATLTLLARNGHVLDYDENGTGTLEALAGAFIPERGAYVLVTGNENTSTGSAELIGTSPLNLRGPQQVGTYVDVVSIAKEFDICVLYGAQSVLATPLRLPPVNGNLWIDPFTVFMILSFVAPANGRHTLTISIPMDPSLIGSNAFFQSVVKVAGSQRTFLTPNCTGTVR